MEQSWLWLLVKAELKLLLSMEQSWLWLLVKAELKLQLSMEQSWLWLLVKRDCIGSRFVQQRTYYWSKYCLKR